MTGHFPKNDNKEKPCKNFPSKEKFSENSFKGFMGKVSLMNMSYSSNHVQTKSKAKKKKAVNKNLWRKVFLNKTNLNLSLVETKELINAIFPSGFYSYNKKLKKMEKLFPRVKIGLFFYKHLHCLQFPNEKPKPDIMQEFSFFPPQFKSTNKRGKNGKILEEIFWNHFNLYSFLKMQKICRRIVL